jgi:16S rRNA G527 N7-methylase RsmG
VASLDVVVSRAVWSTADFLAIARPLLRAEGTAMAMKTPEDAGEGKPSGYDSVAHRPYTLTGGERRVLVLAHSTRST